MVIQMLIAAVVLLLALPTPTAGAGNFKEGEWSLTMTIKFDENSAEARQMQEAQAEMEKMSPQEKALMQNMQGAMGFRMGGGPPGGMTTTITQCLTDKDPVPQSDPKAQDCEESHDIKGNMITFRSVCKGKKSETTTTGHMTYAGNTVKGETRSQEVSRGRMTETTTEITGEYLGPCPEAKGAARGKKG